MPFRLPFVFAVQYAPKGKVNPYMNYPWKLVLARTTRGALERFSKRNPKYKALLIMKV